MVPAAAWGKRAIHWRVLFGTPPHSGGCRDADARRWWRTPGVDILADVTQRRADPVLIPKDRSAWRRPRPDGLCARSPVRLGSVGPGVARDNRGPSRTLIQQITGRLARSVANRPVAYNDGLLGGSHRWHGEPCSRRGQSFLIKPVKAATTAWSHVGRPRRARQMSRCLGSEEGPGGRPGPSWCASNSRITDGYFSHSSLTGCRTVGSAHPA